MPNTATHPAEDFALLSAASRASGERSGRQAAFWMLGLALLTVLTVFALAWYLHRVEVQDEERRRSADAQWLEQSVQFHFRRLEDDLAQRARQLAIDGPQALQTPGQGEADTRPAGLLWRSLGVVQAQAWLAQPGDARGSAGDLQAWRADMASSADNRQQLQLLQDTAAHLRRASYAGPLRGPDGHQGDRVWLAVPSFDGLRLVGLYVVALSMQEALAALLPPWFTDQQQVRIVTDALPPDTIDAADGPYQTAMNLPGADVLLEVLPRGPRTSPTPRLFFAVALVFLLGLLVSLLALRRDFLKRQRVQQRLRAEVALRSAMERSVSTGMRAWDMQGTILYVNQAFCAMVGYSAQQLRGKRAPMPYWPHDQVDELAPLHGSVLRAGTQPQGLEAQYRHRDGHLVDVLIHEAPLLAADGRQLGWMSSVLDISERKRAEQLAAEQQEKLEASERLVAVGEVASTLAHELNQPLGALISFANGLLNRLHASTITLADMEPVVQRMAQLAERAGGVTQRVNAFARRREMHLVRLDLTALVQRAVAMAQEGQATPIALQWPKHAVWVRGDALLLEHLVHNLCSNALDWAGEGGAGATQVQVRLQVDPDAGEARLCVADSGPGVPEAALARLFDAFFSTKRGGMGMGLAICRSIAEAHHGRILVERDALLGGALFTAVLPLDNGA
ncbi:MAG: hypothetical protein ABT03_11865 [Comamonas sp. SCN 67-35]|uniref:sensor histidine kinase n=1 Tax=unclassified Comamonas TaxID=2638500 RepID=UPI00086D846B|nr:MULTISPECIES: PAS domain S-box protein [unclassified Comamonas]MBN9329557.1 PAS domain S-box protein [Comamonas sp.]ODU37583.1 MAG: hypothetical protein ABT03_11865 [Comamonas sp. SCN 67-35]OJW96063.1 MAG: hypothetical protein BGO73_15580 [Burkholderiales bacterium 66-26]